MQEKQLLNLFYINKLKKANESQRKLILVQ